MIFGLYRQLREAGECLAGALCCFVCMGPIITIVGIALIASAGTDDRTPRVSSYNAAVNSWTSGSYQAFTSARYSFLVTSPTGGFTINSAPTGAADPYIVDSDSGITKYTVRTREVAGQTTTDRSPFSWVAPSGVPGAFTSETLQITDTNTGRISSVTVPMGWQQRSYPCTSSDSNSQCVSKCNAKGGSIIWTGNGASTACDRYYLLSEVCLVAGNGTTGVLDNSNKGYGCAVVRLDGYASDSSNIASVTVGSLGPFNFQGVAAASLAAWPAISLTVRSASDPYVTALRLTNGAPSSFGLTIKEKLIGGFAALGIGLAMTAIPACIIMMLIRGVCGGRRTQGTTFIPTPHPSMAYASGGQKSPYAPSGPGMVPGMPVPIPVAGQPAPYGGQTYQPAGPFPPMAPQPGYPAAAPNPYGGASYPAAGGYPQPAYQQAATGYPAQQYPPQPYQAGGYPQQQPSYPSAPPTYR